MKDLTDWVTCGKDGRFYIDGWAAEGEERFIFCHSGKQYCGTSSFDDEVVFVIVEDVVEL